MKYYFLICMAAVAMVCSGLVYADDAKPFTIYASVLNANPPPGTQSMNSGLYTVSEDGKDVKYLGTKVAFAFDAYPEQNLYYMATKNGVMVTKDGGKSWRVTHGWKITEVQHVAALKDNPAIVYVGTPYGLFKSTEYGENFTQLTKKFVEFILIDPNKADRIYMGQEDGLYVSNDAGATFTKFDMNFGSEVNALALDPKSPDKMYVGTEDKGIFITTDGGKTWTQCPAPADKTTIYGITVDKNNPDRVFAATFKDGVLRSMDGGKTWQAFNKGLETYPVFCVAISPSDPNTIFASCRIVGVMKSTDNGETWSKFALDTAQVWKIEIK